MAIIEVEIENSLLEEATKVYERYGLDLNTAITLFLQRCIEVNGLPFSSVLDKKPCSNGIEILKQMQKIAEENGTSNMTLEEINEEIAKARAERKTK